MDFLRRFHVKFVIIVRDSHCSLWVGPQSVLFSGLSGPFGSHLPGGGGGGGVTGPKAGYRL